MAYHRPHPYSKPNQTTNRDRGNSNGMRNPSGDFKKDRERPSRTLFVRNVSYEVSEDDLRPIFEQFGEIKKFFNIVSKRGMAFITYYDLRDADKAKRELQNYEIGSRPIDIHYSLPKDDNDSEDPNSGTLYVILTGNSSDVSIQDLKSHFEQWGEIREVRDCKGSQNTKFVEYWSLRDSENACINSNGSVLKGSKLEVRFAFHTKDKRDEGKPMKDDYPRSMNNMGSNMGHIPLQNPPMIPQGISQTIPLMPNLQTQPSQQIQSNLLHPMYQPSMQTSGNQRLIPSTTSSNQTLALDQMTQLATLLNANKQSNGVASVQQIAALIAQQQQQQLQQQQQQQQQQHNDPRNYRNSPYSQGPNKYNY